MHCDAIFFDKMHINVGLYLQYSNHNYNSLIYGK